MEWVGSQHDFCCVTRKANVTWNDELKFKVAFKWIVPHKHHCLLQKIDCFLLDYLSQLVVS